MSREEVKSVIHRFYEQLINRADFQSAEDILADDFHDHDLSDIRIGTEGLKSLLTMLTTAFPDIHVEIEDIVVEGDTAAVRLRVTGTQNGVLMGTIPPSGKHAVWSGMDFLKLSDGRIVERYGVRDRLGLMQQIGAIRN